MENELIKALLERRSIRKYDTKQISDDELDTILNAGLYAASAMNRQETKIVAVRDKETRDFLSKLNAKVMDKDTDPFYGAPCVLVVFAKNDYCYWQDGSLVMANLMQAAYSIGLGSCWINRAKEMFEFPEGIELKKKWGIPEDYMGIGNCIVGYPLETVSAKPRKENRIIKID